MSNNSNETGDTQPAPGDEGAADTVLPPPPLLPEIPDIDYDRLAAGVAVGLAAAAAGAGAVVAGPAVATAAAAAAAVYVLQSAIDPPRMLAEDEPDRPGDEQDQG